MDKEKIRSLLHESFHRKLTPEEKILLNSALREDDSLRAEKEDTEKVIHDLGNLRFGFREGFVDRVMDKIGTANGKVVEVDFSEQLFTFFKRIALAGAAAIILILLSIYISHGSLSKESVLGVQSMSDDNLVSYLLYEEE